MVVYIKNHFSQCRTDFGKVDTKNSEVEEKYKVHSFFFNHMCGSFSRPHKIAKTLPQKLNKLFFHRKRARSIWKSAANWTFVPSATGA